MRCAGYHGCAVEVCRCSWLWYQVKGKDFVYNGEDDEPIDYFLTILPRMKHHALKTGL